MQKPDRSSYTPVDFSQWRDAGALDLTPKFQRRGVWTPAARSYFIDTLLRQMPIPPIYIRMTQSQDSTKIVRQVVDGQQRVSAVMDFVDGEFRLSRTLKNQWAYKSFDDLSKDDQRKILGYGFPSEVFQGISDLEVLEVFARLNTYSVALNAQELRNGRYFGVFKQSAYTLAYEHLEFWRNHGIFTERKIARMSEVELTSELMILRVDGIQDKKKSIDQFYTKYDDSFPLKNSTENRFREVLDTINESFPETLRATEFNRIPLFYSLFGAVYHRLHGIANVSIATPKRALSRQERVSLRGAAEKLSPMIQSGQDGDPVPTRYEKFVAACLRQTDNIQPRALRLIQIYKEAFG